jgi:23S rRNA pseudouridine2605 synthase
MARKKNTSPRTSEPKKSDPFAKFKKKINASPDIKAAIEKEVSRMKKAELEKVRKEKARIEKENLFQDPANFKQEGFTQKGKLGPSTKSRTSKSDVPFSKDPKLREKEQNLLKAFGGKSSAPKKEFITKSRTPNSKEESVEIESDDSKDLRLSKYVAHSGIAARRKAAELIKEGQIWVNDKINTEPGYKVQPNDKVTYQGKVLDPVGKLVYILLNKPKNTITTTDDDRGRKTVMELVKNATDSRVFPVGRLDRATTGLLILTNDGELAERLSHPRHKVKKVYHATLNKTLSKNDLEAIQNGITLEDGPVKVDAIGYIDGKSKSEIGLEIHIGKNRIVRRIFEHLGYEVEKLDRTFYGGLTKKGLNRGFWRHLTKKEIILLKHF